MSRDHYKLPEVDPKAQWAIFGQDGGQLSNWTRWDREITVDLSDQPRAAVAVRIGTWSRGRFAGWANERVTIHHGQVLSVRW